MRVSPVVTLYDLAGTVNRMSITNVNGTRQNGITLPSTVSITPISFRYTAGGITGTTGTNGTIELSKIEATAEL
jgi:hypothetical protein